MPLKLVMTMLMLCANHGRAESLRGKWSYHWRAEPLNIARCVRISKQLAQRLARLDCEEEEGDVLRCDEDQSGYRIFASQADCVADRDHMVAVPF
jgi:hypothetical protein